MLGVGWTEMLVIGVVALIVVGPKDLPMMMNRLGKAIGMVRRMGSEFQREINRSTGLDTMTDLRKSLTDPLKKTAAEITREFNKTTPSGAVEPSGVIAPKDPKVESVVDEIHAKVGMTPAAKAVESPAPVEAIAPAAKPARKPRAKKVAPKAEVTRSAAADATAVPAAKAPKKPAAARKPRQPKPKAEA